MKKIFAILMTICLVVSMLSISTFAALLLDWDAVPQGAVLRVSALKSSGTTEEDIEVIDNYYNFEDGWNYAMELAGDPKKMKNNGYDRIIVDLFADWKANEKGVFGDGEGFREDTIYIPEEARVMLNINGHTINRGLGDRNRGDGEVICIDEKVDVIINGGKYGDEIARADDTNAMFGTITGGNSDSGAGGIYIQDDANVTLNNVKIVNNVADGDYGAGIAVYDDAKFAMNGGGFIGNKNNSYVFDSFGIHAYGGGIYIEDSTASFDNVLFEGNQFTYNRGHGAALYAYDSSVTMNKCKVVGNGKNKEADGTVGADSIITVKEGDMLIKETEFTGNGDIINLYDGTSNCLIDVDAYIVTAQLSIDNCTFTQNNVGYILDLGNNSITVTKSRFTDNHANVLYCGTSEDTIFTDCVFNNNNCATVVGNYTFKLNSGSKGPTFIDCDMGNSTYNDRNRVRIENSGIGSVFGEGSLAMIVSILAFIASGVSIFLVVYYNKKKAVPAEVNGASESNDKE